MGWLGRFAAMASCAGLVHASPLGVLAVVEIELARGKDRLRPSLQPEVDQIEVVRAFVHQDTTAVVLVPVPPPEIVGVQGVQLGVPREEE